jgi:hypothetical protein
MIISIILKFLFYDLSNMINKLFVQKMIIRFLNNLNKIWKLKKYKPNKIKKGKKIFKFKYIIERKIYHLIDIFFIFNLSIII